MPVVAMALMQASLYGPVAPRPVPPAGSAPRGVEACPRGKDGEVVVCAKTDDPYRLPPLTHRYDPPDGLPLIHVKLPGGLCIVGLSVGTCG